MTDWGVPDWTKEKDYSAPRGPTEMCIWAWEFLRRWDEYRAFWKEKIEPFIDGRGWICRDVNGNYWPYLDELESRFGVYLPSPPQSATASRFTANRVRWVQNDGRESQKIYLEKHEAAFIFDLLRPIKPQLEAAHDAAKREQKLRSISIKRARSRTELYISYLRILDAREAGENTQDIADQLFPKLSNEHPTYYRQKRLFDYRKAAERLRDGGYRSLLAA